MLWWFRVAIQAILVMAIISVIGYAIRNQLSFLKRKKDASSEPKEAKKEEKKKGRISHFFAKLVATLFFVWLALVFAADIRFYGTKAFRAAADGATRAYNNAPLPTSTVDALPQGKSVGGPLLWDEETARKERVKIRNRRTIEEAHNGVVFVGMIPPASWADLSLSCVSTPGATWDAYLVSRNNLGFLQEHVLRTHAITKHETDGTIFHLAGLSSPSMLHELRYENYTGKKAEEGCKLNEMYIQSIGERPSQFMVDRVEPTGTFQYVVEVGLESTSFTIPEKNWKWAWIAAVHTKAYQASVDGISIPAEGISKGGHHEHLALIANVDGEKRVLDKAVLLKPIASDRHVTLRLNSDIVTEENLEESVRPAKIIVGIQL